MSFLDDLTKKVGDAAKTAAKKSGDLVEITKLNMAINSEDDKIKAIYSDIGRYIYNMYGKGESLNPDISGKCQQIKVIEDNIAVIKEKVNQIKNSSVEAAQPMQQMPQYGGSSQFAPPIQQGWQQAPVSTGNAQQYPPMYVPDQAVPQFVPQNGGVQADPQYIPVIGVEQPDNLPGPVAGTEGPGQKRLCPSCGSLISADWKFCQLCGAKL